ncbi:MAG: hypothetical protein ACKO46_00020, partial [Alphaproteobacteria bacterium]
ARAATLEIEAKYYINALFRASNDEINLEFDDKSAVKLQSAKRKVFAKDEKGTYQTEAGTISVEEKKKEMDKLMIGKAKKEKGGVTFVDGLKGDAPAVTALTGNAVRAIAGIEKALTFNSEDLQEKKHFDWWFVNDFQNENAGGLLGDRTRKPCTYSAEDKKSLLGNSDYLEKSLDLANKYFDELLKTKGEKEEIYGIRLIKIYNYLTILQNDKEKNENSLLKDDTDLGKKFSVVFAKLQTAIRRNYKNNGRKGILDHDGLIRNIKNLVVDDAKQNTYHEIFNNKTPATALGHPSAGLVDSVAPRHGLSGKA